MEEMDSRDYEDLCETWKRVNQLQGANLNPRVVLYRADVQICEIGKRPRLLHIKEEQEDVTIKQEEEEEQQLMLTPLNVKAEDEEIPLLLLHNTPERDGFIRLLRVQRLDQQIQLDCEDLTKTTKAFAACSTASSPRYGTGPSGHVNSDKEQTSRTDCSENQHIEHQSGGVDFKKANENSRQSQKSKGGRSQSTKSNIAESNVSVRDEVMQGHASPQCSKRVLHKSSSDDPKEDSNAKRAPFSCPDCGVSFTRIDNLNRHAAVHTGEKPFSCTVCDSKFAQKYNLNSHMSTCHPNHFPHICSVCKNSYTSTKALDLHMQSHAEKKDEKPLCSECGRSFAKKSNLKVHMRIHTGERPFSCAVCDKEFIESRSLQRHMCTHTGERPFSCTECGNEFKQVAHYHSHMRIHSGEKPFSCKVCNRGFSRSTHVTSHMKVHRTKKPFNCKVCFKGFVQKARYRAHMKVHYIQDKYGVTSYGCFSS